MSITRYALYRNILFICLMISAGGTVSGFSWSQELENTLSGGGITGEAASGITKLFVEADNARIPVEVLLPRLEEGIAKRVAPNRIITVLEREIQAYAVTRNIVLQTLGEQDGRVMLQSAASWSRTVTLYLLGVSPEELSVLLHTFQGQRSPDRWQNYRYGSSLYAALLQWGMEKEESLGIVSAAAQSQIPGNSYKGLIDILITGVRLRVSPEAMAKRIITSLPGSRSIEDLQDRVLY